MSGALGTVIAPKSSVMAENRGNARKPAEDVLQDLLSFWRSQLRSTSTLISEVSALSTLQHCKFACPLHISIKIYLKQPWTMIARRSTRSENGLVDHNSLAIHLMSQWSYPQVWRCLENMRLSFNFTSKIRVFCQQNSKSGLCLKLLITDRLGDFFHLFSTTKTQIRSDYGKCRKRSSRHC